jgi:3-isopropylmalate/(R)-2-methylmalate dehydratase small subunit
MAQASQSQIEQVAGRAVTVRGNDIDTDQIVPARYLKCITFQGMEDALFVDTRKALKEQGTAHPLDEARFAGASILLVNKNFGCGSSREHAPQALRRFGIRAVVGESFGEIFAGNCVAIGLPCLLVDEATIARLQERNEAQPDSPLKIDVAGKRITAGNEVFTAEISEGRRRQFVDGSWDATGVLLAAGPSIEAKARELDYISG